MIDRQRTEALTEILTLLHTLSPNFQNSSSTFGTSARTREGHKGPGACIYYQTCEFNEQEEALALNYPSLYPRFARSCLCNHVT